MIEPWRVRDSRVAFEDRWIKHRVDRCVDRSGRAIEPYHVLEFPSWINVVAITERREILLAREYRHGAGEILTALPCGAMEPGDPDPESAARRELEEETGYAGGKTHALASGFANPANQTNRAWSILALGVRPIGLQRPDPTEEIEVVPEDFVGFMARFWRGGVAIQASHAAAIHQAALALMKASGPADGGLRRAIQDEFTRVIEEV